MVLISQFFKFYFLLPRINTNFIHSFIHSEQMVKPKKGKGTIFGFLDSAVKEFNGTYVPCQLQRCSSIY